MYITSEDNDGNFHLWGFTKGELYDLTGAIEVNARSKVIPFFAPANNSQVIIIYPEDNMLRIFEHSVEQGDCKVNRKMKIHHETMFKDVNLNTLHTGIFTENNNFLILVDDKDLHIFDMRGAKLQKNGAYEATAKARHVGVNIQGL